MASSHSCAVDVNASAMAACCALATASTERFALSLGAGCLRIDKVRSDCLPVTWIESGESGP